MGDSELPPAPKDEAAQPASPAASSDAMAPPAGLPPPEAIGKYRIVRLLGRGGMGAVYHAFDPLLERDVALKVMLPQFADRPEHKLRFEREARAVARMMHPNVVMVFDLGYHTDGSPYIVMELLKGRDLLHLLREEPDLDLRSKVAITIQVLRGLGHAHKVGIVHRDIKPANVFIVENGDAKIMDFGIARIGASGMAASGVVVGTANYMSPEQVTGGAVDGRSDLFSVGCLLAEMAGGRPPFESDSVMSTLYRIAHSEPIIELPAGPGGEQLGAVLHHALAKDPEKRVGTAAELAAALQGLLEQPSFGSTPAAKTVVISSSVAPTRAVPRAATVPGAPPTSPPRVADPAPLFRLLREIYVGGKSGHLHLTSGHERRLLRLLRGRIVDGSSDVQGERLGDVLVRYGLLSQADLERAVAVVLRERRKIGQVLAEMGLLDRPRLEDALGLHVREVLFVMLDRPGASFVFEEMAESLIETDLSCRLSTGELILEATRRVQDPAMVRRVIGDPSRVLVLSSDPILRSQRITLTPVDGFVLSRIDGTLGAREVLSLIPLPAEDVERSLFGLLCTGMVGHHESRPSTRPLPRLGDTAARATREIPTPAPRAQATPAPRAQATPAPRAPVPETPQSMARAMPSSPPPTPQSMARAEPRGSHSSVGEVRRLILETHDRLAEGTHYDVLGIDRGASDAEVRQAHARLVRLLHPDACGAPELDDVQAERAAVFVRVGQAFEVLRDLKSRAAYDTHLKLWKPEAAQASEPSESVLTPGSPPSTPALSGVDDERSSHVRALSLAEAHLQQERYWDVIQALEPLVPRLQGALKARCRYLLASAYVKNPKWRHRAEEALRLAIEDDPRQVDAHLLLARIYAEAGLSARAGAMYRKVLTLDPQNAEALQAAPPPSAPAPPEPPSTLKRLLGKH